MKSTPIEQIFETHLQTLALTLRPNTVKGYRSTVRSFLAYSPVRFADSRSSAAIPISSVGSVRANIDDPHAV